MKIKKFTKVLSALAVVSSLALAGCASSTGTKATGTQAIKDRGVLKVGVKVDVPKFGYKDSKTGKIDGFEVDLARSIAKKILGDENKIEVQGVTAKTRGPLLDSGEVDLVIATFTITEERKKSYNFSQAYLKDGVGLLVKKSSGLKSFKDFNGKKVGVAQSATSKKALQEAAKENNLNVQFLEFGSYPEIKTALDSGRVDAFSVDKAILFGYLDDSTEILPDSFTEQEYGVASQKGNDELAKIVDETVEEMIQSGDRNKLLAKWGLK